MKNVGRLLAVFFLFVIGVHLYRNVLPYQYSSQWIPNPEALGAGNFYDHSEEVGEYLGQQVTSYDVPVPKQLAQVLGENDGANKRIEVDLTNQRVYAFEGSNKVMDFLVSTGKWGRTPTGTFNIAYKTRAQKMSGGSRALNTYYYLPNVPFVQFFGNAQIPWSRGFSFHGTYWHSNFGQPMSHGCINMKTEDAEKLFYWTPGGTGRIDGGTTVVIYGNTPTS